MFPIVFYQLFFSIQQTSINVVFILNSRNESYTISIICFQIKHYILKSTGYGYNLNVKQPEQQNISNILSKEGNICASASVFKDQFTV